MPEGPAVARRRALQLGRHGMDRALMLGRNETAIGAHLGAPAPRPIDQDLARPQEAALDEAAERDASRLAARFEENEIGRRRAHRGDAPPRQRDISGVLLDPDKSPGEP